MQRNDIENIKTACEYMEKASKALTYTGIHRTAYKTIEHNLASLNHMKTRERLLKDTRNIDKACEHTEKLLKALKDVKSVRTALENTIKLLKTIEIHETAQKTQVTHITPCDSTKRHVKHPNDMEIHEYVDVDMKFHLKHPKTLKDTVMSVPEWIESGGNIENLLNDTETHETARKVCKALIGDWNVSPLYGNT